MVHGSAYHSQSQGAVEKFNDNTISKLRFFKLENKENFNIEEPLEKAVDIYNKKAYSVIKIEPFKAIKLYKKKILMGACHICHFQKCQHFEFFNKKSQKYTLLKSWHFFFLSLSVSMTLKILSAMSAYFQKCQYLYFT